MYLTTTSFVSSSLFSPFWCRFAGWLTLCLVKYLAKNNPTAMSIAFNINKWCTHSNKLQMFLNKMNWCDRTVCYTYIYFFCSVDGLRNVFSFSCNIRKYIYFYWISAARNISKKRGKTYRQVSIYKIYKTFISAKNWQLSKWRLFIIIVGVLGISNIIWNKL